MAASIGIFCGIKRVIDNYNKILNLHAFKMS